MKNLRKKYLEWIDADIARASNDFKNACNYLKNSTAIFTRGNLSPMTIPKMHVKTSFDIIKTELEAIYNMLDSIIERYLIDTDLQQLFGFSDKLNELILLKKQYKNNLPICRLDIFFNEDNYQFKFCEFNADGASAMNEDREIYNGFKNSSLYIKLNEEHTITSFELFDSWVKEWGVLYQEWVNARKKALNHATVQSPTQKEKNAKTVVAIVDFLDIGTKSEFKVFQEAFIRAGYECVIVDITTLQYIDGVLYTADGLAIDGIYRRAVTSECMDKYDLIKDFINAVKDDSVCVIGAFRTQIIHDKNFFRLLRHPYVQAILTTEQKQLVEKHIPMTYALNDGDFDDVAVYEDKDKWIIKPSDRYGSFNVHTGGDYSNKEWFDLINKYKNQGFVLQEYCPPYRARDCYFDDAGNIVYGEFGYMTGVFMYNGCVRGLYTRAMLNRTTTQQNEGRVTTTILVD